MSPPIVWMTLVFESILILIALGLGAVTGVSPFAMLTFSPRSWVLGLAATLPLIAFLCWSLRTPWTVLVQFRAAVLELVVPLFRGCSPVHMALVALAAGVGEEALFRGLLQPLGERFMPTSASLIAVSILFGLAHAINRTYAVVASLIGLYLGTLLLATGSLLSPIVAHALYDFVALLVIVNRRSVDLEDRSRVRARASSPGASDPPQWGGPDDEPDPRGE